jgi:hypothetical protein
MFAEVSAAITAGVMASPVSPLDFPHEVLENADDGRRNKSLLAFPDLVLDSITSSACTDDSSVALSCISDESIDSMVEEVEDGSGRKRSIFCQYWKNTGQQPMDLKPASNSIRSMQPMDSKPASDSIRSMPVTSASPPSPYLVGDEKARSEPTLVHPKPVSILRQSKSGRRRERSTSVTFGDKVSVLFFQPPAVVIHEGWSKFFA